MPLMLPQPTMPIFVFLTGILAPPGRVLPVERLAKASQLGEYSKARRRLSNPIARLAICRAAGAIVVLASLSGLETAVTPARSSAQDEDPDSPAGRLSLI